jgi:AcrR family transcriptional regulator
MARPARIDRAQILAEALALADEQGLEALTMGAVAERLGVTAMALYRHVGNKADLLDGLVELLLTGFPTPSEEMSWPERLSALADRVRATARCHPAVFPLLLQRPASTPDARRTRNAVYQALVEAGIAEDRLAQVERLLSTAILGFAVSEVAGRFRNQSRRQLDADFEALQGMLSEFIVTQTRVTPYAVERR